MLLEPEAPASCMRWLGSAPHNLYFFRLMYVMTSDAKSSGFV